MADELLDELRWFAGRGDSRWTDDMSGHAGHPRLAKSKVVRTIIGGLVNPSYADTSRTAICATAGRTDRSRTPIPDSRSRASSLVACV